MKKYKCGLYIGRFQPLHNGHMSVISRMFEECDVVIIAIGSAQEHGTKKNPFSYGLRSNIIFNAFSSKATRRLIIIPIVDRENPSNDASWGDYVFKIVETYTGLVPDAIYEGKENERTHWYDNYNIPIVCVKRSNISATQVRQDLLSGNKDKIYMTTPLEVCILYDKLREELLKCYS